MHLKKRDFIFVAGSAFALIIIYYISWLIFGKQSSALLVVISWLLIAVIQIEIYRRLEPLLCEQSYNYRQLEHLSSLQSLLNIKAPLPPMRDWAASPDFLNIIISTIKSTQAETIVELGSGVSTITTGTYLKSLGKGQIISLDHEEHYAEKSRSTVALHEIGDVALVIHAPLIPTPIGEKTWLWYTLQDLNIKNKIDIVVVDGPPTPIQPLSRYPALPALFERLSDNATLIIDDGKMQTVRDMVELWQREYPNLEVEYINTEKGTYIVNLNRQG